MNPEDFIITRKRKQYKFALFYNSPLCFEAAAWQEAPLFRPDVLEVGAGNGLFSVAQASLFPDKNFVALDVKADRLQHGARQAAALGLKNIAFVRITADKLLQLFPAHSVEKLWITFPDPFPRARAAKHRLTHQRFLGIYRSLLRPNSALYFKTDNHQLFDWSIEHFITHRWMLDELTYDLHATDFPEAYKQLTTYEKRFLSEGLTTCYLRARPPSADAPKHR